jgi:hypothetical protein
MMNTYMATALTNLADVYKVLELIFVEKSVI